MKRIILLVISAMLITGCNSPKEQRLECSKETMQNENKVIETIITNYDKDNVSNMEIKTETILDDKYLEYIDTFEKQINSSFEKYKGKKGIDINITKADSKIVLNMIINVLSLDDETKKDLSITDTYSSYENAKKILKNDGYLCK